MQFRIQATQFHVFENIDDPNFAPARADADAGLFRQGSARGETPWTRRVTRDGANFTNVTVGEGLIEGMRARPGNPYRGISDGQLWALHIRSVVLPHNAPEESITGIDCSDNDVQTAVRDIFQVGACDQGKE